MKAKEYDYIIVGAGSAGCVLANRLSEDATNKVLLLEAGGKDNKLYIGIPAAFSNLHRTDVDWGFWTEPQQHVNNRAIYIPRGKALGGCSTTNAMAYVRGNKHDYNEWARLGNSGWSYEEVLPYFKKSEHNEDLKNDYHGQNGLLNVTHPRYYRTDFSQAFIQACKEIGLAENNDYNGAEQQGAGMFQFTIKDGKRHSTAAAFLKPAMQRENLSVITHAHAKQILLEGKKAVGVEYIRKNKIEKVYASKEVILSAGAFQSPQLLMLSGIGDPAELTKHGIAVKHELPGVGKNLQDHLFVVTSSLSKKQDGFNHHLKPFQQIKDLVRYYFSSGKGPLSCSPLEAVAFLGINGSDTVNLQFHFAPMHLGNDYAANFYDPDTFPRIDGYSIAPTLLKPKSRGYVGLKSADPLAAPLIQPNFLSAPDDMQVLVEGCKLALEAMHANAFKPHVKEVIAPVDRSDKGLEEHIRKSVETIFHPVGSCKMGKDDMAVVNDKLQVHGIDGLRVADASIMPVIVAGNTNAACIMIGEKASDLVLSN